MPRNKSGIMLGLGEKEEEVFQTMEDLRDVVWTYHHWSIFATFKKIFACKGVNYTRSIQKNMKRLASKWVFVMWKVAL